ncbi:hypothetical protein [uncultured Kordia sp.]|uniref:hypothetical protein n=1 Tax=uncultured Kordia sp. TaxID=507699 RepID=UPI0026319777|nr:hypothetical protein [uncultured Kordia sp.]
MDIASKKTSDGKLIVDFIESVEPNNGRLLFKINVIHNNININEKLFSNNWNYINFRIDKWQLEGFGYVYIPVEGTPKLLHVDTLEIHDLSYRRISTVLFLGNIFEFNMLVEIYSDVIEITDLNTLNTRIIFKYKSIESVEWVRFLNEKEIEVTLVKNTRGKREKRSEIRRI